MSNAVLSSRGLTPTAISRCSLRSLSLCAALMSMLLGTSFGPWSRGLALPEQGAERSKIAEGEYAIFENHNGGGVGPFEEKVFNFHESWTLWRVRPEQYRIEGVRRFESPQYDPHSNRFIVELTRDFTVIRMKEFAKLRWVPNSGPLSCEFLPTRLECSSGGSDPQREIKMRTQLEKPYGLLWPISPFSFAGIAREVERDPAHATLVDLVRIEQPSKARPVQAMILRGPFLYLGEEDFETAGRKWHAHKFSVKVPLGPQFLLWTSRKGLLLAMATEREHNERPEEGMRLTRFDGPPEF